MKLAEKIKALISAIVPTFGDELVLCLDGSYEGSYLSPQTSRYGLYASIKITCDNVVYLNETTKSYLTRVNLRKTGRRTC